MFARLRDEYLRLRKLAIKANIPDWALLHADKHANVGLFKRSRAQGRRYALAMDRAKREMFEAVQLLKGYLQAEGRLKHYKTPLLDKLIKGK